MFWLKKPCSIPRDFNSTFQLAPRILSFQVSIILLQSSSLARSVIRWSQLENWKCFLPIEKSYWATPQEWKIPLLFCYNNFSSKFTKICLGGLIVPAEVEEAIKMGEMESVSLSKTCDKAIFKSMYTFIFIPRWTNS